MRLVKTLIFSLSMCFVMVSFSQCSGSKNTQETTLQKTAPTQLDKPYYQAWVAGIQGGGSGINVFMPSRETSVKLDSAYFRGMKAKVEITNEGYIARFKTKANQKDDVIMSSESNSEYGNQLPQKENFPFQLKDNECVISYYKDNTLAYFKIEDLFEKAMAQYPSAPPRH